MKAVIFDLDGTLVDTEEVDNDVALDLCRKLGFELTGEEQQERHGRTTKSFYTWLKQHRNADFNLEEVIQKQLDLFEAALRKGVKSFPGAKELPKLLKEKGCKLAIVSGSTSGQIEIDLKALGIRDCFDVIVSADDINNSKPDPEGYLLAAQKLGIKPEECVVIEDGRKGIEAGKSAGMKVIGVVNRAHQDISGADIQVKDLTQISLDLLS